MQIYQSLPQDIIKIKLLKRKRFASSSLVSNIEGAKIGYFSYLILTNKYKYSAYDQDLQYNYFGEAENFLVTVE